MFQIGFSGLAKLFHLTLCEGDSNSYAF